ncbi:MAG TPA: Stp1/IreP family PP2C-type Ser/Thr phosphatase [Chloroflexota bacterium]|jgi:protein phosphatase|nr:Stp1/IreP family PP2C-type Ser/Thr phosphatase [Chloroflexota bacterium]
MRLDIAGLTDVGRKRKRNEDAFSIKAFGEWTFCIVADGMGGHIGGDTASRLAVEGAQAGFEAETGSVGDRLLASVEQANVLVWREAERQPHLMGMGTTFVGLAIRADHFQVIHVGDSRAYLADPTSIRQLTVDHSWVGEQVAIGKMTAEEAAKHPYRSAITRCVGCQPTVEPDLQPEEPLAIGSAVVLCSDGLTNHLSDDEIHQVAISETAEDACQSLIKLANDRGGIDNITVIVARAVADEPGEGLR